MSDLKPPPPLTPKKPMSGCLLLVIVVVGFVLVMWGCTAIIGASGDGDDQSFNGVRYPDMEAIAGCESLVEDQLRSPASADFSSTVTRAGDEWTVTGYVDADNAFGAQVRTDYACTVTFPGGGQVRTVIDEIG